MLEATVGFLGAGKMGEALARGLLRARTLPPERLLLSDSDPQRRKAVAQALGVEVLDDNRRLVQAADVLVVALKPDVARDVLPELADAITPDKLLVSIAAGVSLAELEAMVGADKRVVRVMPNTPALVGAGAAGYAPGRNATEDDAATVEKLLGAVGLCVRVPEKLLDAVTGLSGSGPAFVAVFIEALADGGVLCGLPRQQALTLAAQTSRTWSHPPAERPSKVFAPSRNSACAPQQSQPSRPQPKNPPSSEKSGEFLQGYHHRQL